MKCYSTRDKKYEVSFREAVINGLAPDGGLYMPREIPLFPKEYFRSLFAGSFTDISYDIASKYLSDELNSAEIEKIITDSISFPAPLVNIKENIYSLELFHGPTLAFKDFGARFMARLLSKFSEGLEDEINIIVATSGDTGSAVANGFYNVPGINVFILYPEGRVSPLQEKQLTTYGGNITALEIDGSFDDCQKLVKSAFNDKELRKNINLSSANSINIARLLPQSFYYFEAYRQAGDAGNIVFTVPSGNLGNLTAGVLAYKMGLPVERFIAATNKNDVFTKYLAGEGFTPVPSVRTISNAMDVGNPSNFERLVDIFGSQPAMSRLIKSYSFDDDLTRKKIREIYGETGYLPDPHGAVGLLAAAQMSDEEKNEYRYVILETAHPAKFRETVEEEIAEKISVPQSLADYAERDKVTVKLPAEYNVFREFLLERK